MFNYTELLGLLAGILAFISFFVYYVSIFRKKTIPNQTTWLILTVVGILIAASYYSVGARDTIWVPVAYILGPLITFILSLKYGVKSWSLFDKTCLILSAVSILVWLLSGNPLFTLLINIFIDFLGILPTVRKTYMDPISEDLLTWILVTIESILNLLAISEWNFSIYIYPIYMLFFNSLIMLLILLPLFKSRFKRSFF